MEFKLQPLAKQSLQWKVVINGDERPDVLHAVFSSRWGFLEFGQGPDGSERWSFKEAGGGGVVTIPYAFTDDRELLIGLVLEYRPNMAETPVLCAIGGFVDIGESHRDAQIREAVEEACLDTMTARQLEGVPTNSDRLYYIAEYGKEGVRAYALEFPFAALETHDNMWKLRCSCAVGVRNSNNVRFMHWKRAVQLTSDALARSAIAQLLAELI